MLTRLIAALRRLARPPRPAPAPTVSMDDLIRALGGEGL